MAEEGTRMNLCSFLWGNEESLGHAGRVTSGLVRTEPRGHGEAGEALHRDSEVRSLDSLQQASVERRSLHSRRVVEGITSYRDHCVSCLGNIREEGG